MTATTIEKMSVWDFQDKAEKIYNRAFPKYKRIQNPTAYAEFKNKQYSDFSKIFDKAKNSGVINGYNVEVETDYHSIGVYYSNGQEIARVSCYYGNGDMISVTCTIKTFAGRKIHFTAYINGGK